MRCAISIKKTIGVGDALQFSSTPENYFRTTGHKLIDTSGHWFFDHNPFIERETDTPLEVLKSKYGQDLVLKEMWDFHHPQPMPLDRECGVYLSLAERHATAIGAKVFLKYPRIYQFEDFPYEKRQNILIHTQGKSHGTMPDHVIDHVKKKYKNMPLFHVGLPTDKDIGLQKIETRTLWDLAKVISTSRMFIGMDSGPSWIACCFPDVVVKKLRAKPLPERFQSWIPMQISNIHSHWDDRIFSVHTASEDDIGFTSSYKRI